MNPITFHPHFIRDFNSHYPNLDSDWLGDTKPTKAAIFMMVNMMHSAKISHYSTRNHKLSDETPLLSTVYSRTTIYNTIPEMDNMDMLIYTRWVELVETLFNVPVPISFDLMDGAIKRLINRTQGRVFVSKGLVSMVLKRVQMIREERENLLINTINAIEFLEGEGVQDILDFKNDIPVLAWHEMGGRVTRSTLLIFNQIYSEMGGAEGLTWIAAINQKQPDLAEHGVWKLYCHKLVTEPATMYETEDDLVAHMMVCLESKLFSKVSKN